LKLASLYVAIVFLAQIFKCGVRSATAGRAILTDWTAKRSTMLYIVGIVPIPEAGILLADASKSTSRKVSGAFLSMQVVDG
jgi:hypothetical protein